MSSSYSARLGIQRPINGFPLQSSLAVVVSDVGTIKLSSLKRTTGLTPPCQVGPVVALSRCYNIPSVRQTLVLSAHAQSPGTAAFPIYNSSLSRPPNNLRSVSRLSPPRREPRLPPARNAEPRRCAARQNSLCLGGVLQLLELKRNHHLENNSVSSKHLGCYEKLSNRIES